MANTGDKTWGHLEDTEGFGRLNKHSEFIELSKDELTDVQYSECMQAAHCMIYAPYSDKIFGVYDPRAAVLMQMRFDGYIGFPGGLVDAGESNVFGLNREIIEEMAAQVNVTDGHHIITHYAPAKKLCLHFYAVEVTYDKLKDIERNAFRAHDFGTEVLGTLRVPLYTMGDGYRGFPNFLTNSFIGNAREQLLHTLVHLKIMTEDEVDEARTAKVV